MAKNYFTGAVVWALDVPDENGGNHKDRFVVLIEDVDDENDRAFCVGISTKFTRPLPRTSVELPFGVKGGRCTTGLPQESIANCLWVVEVSREDIEYRAGHLSGRHLEEILALVDEMMPPG